MSCVLIHKKRINSIGKFNNLDIKKIIENELGRIVTFSSINIADYKYMNTNIIYMPYIDTHRIAAINNFYVLGLTEEPVEIWTYEENFEKIKSLLNKESKYLCSFRKIEEIR